MRHAAEAAANSFRIGIFRTWEYKFGFALSGLIYFGRMIENLKHE